MGIQVVRLMVGNEQPPLPREPGQAQSPVRVAGPVCSGDLPPGEPPAVGSTVRGVSVVIPACNEAEGIASVVRNTHAVLSEMPGLTFEILVVDDGSTDETSARVPPGQARVIRHPKNYGYGRSLLTGIAKARWGWIAILDADGTYDPRDLTRMLPLLEIFDMVVGARQIRRQGFLVSWLRRFLKSILWFFTGAYSPDPNSGLRVFRKELVQRGKSLFSQKFSFTTSLTFFATLTHAFIEYLPIEYHSRTGHSKVRHLRDSLRTFVLVISMALVFQPVKCYLAHGLVTLLGLGILTVWQTSLGMGLWLALSLMWLSGSLLMAIAFLAFILSKTWERHPEQP